MNKQVMGIAALIVFVGALYLFLTQKKCSVHNNSDTFIVGMMSGWPPFMSVNEQGQYEGFDVDVAQELAHRLGKKLVIQDMGSLAPLFVALEQRRIDAIFSGLTITPQRKEKLNMIFYCGKPVKTLSLIFWKEIPQGVFRIEDLVTVNNAVVCVEPASPAEDFLNSFQMLTKKPITALADLLLELQYGKSLCALVDPEVAERYQKQLPDLRVLEVPLPQSLWTFGNGIALLPSNERLGTDIENSIKSLRETGFLEKLEQTWGV